MPDPVETRQWRRLVAFVNQHAPRSPISVSNALQQYQSAAGNTVGAAGALAGGLNRSLPDAVGPVTGLATAGSVQDVADAAVDEVVGRGADVFLRGVDGVNPDPVAGLIVGNGLAVLRGAVRAVERSDRVEDYLNQLGGYTDALARCSIDAMFESVPYATLPQPPVPSYANNMGQLYSGRTRGSWIRGHGRVATVIRDLDRLRPTHGDWYSKVAFIRLFLNAVGMTFVRGRPETGRRRQRIAEAMWRERMRIEEYIVTNILFINELRQVTRLRRFGNSG